MTESIPIYNAGDNDVTDWLCPNGHVLGQVRRRNGIRRLELFRIADRDGVIAELTGTAEVHCSSCGEIRTWFAPEEGMRELLARQPR